MKVAVIGGGPAGLTTLKFLATAHEYFPIEPIEVRLFEGEDEIGGTFAHRVYEDAELVSSKYLTAFSDFRLPAEAPDFVTPPVYVQYLRDYVTNFNLGNFIECGCRLRGIRRDVRGDGHVLSIQGPDDDSFEWHCDAVAVCTGLNGRPYVPDLRGIERVPIVLHSSKIKSRAQFGKDTNVVVLGAGETGMDISHLAVTSPTRYVTLCHRDGFFCAPKVGNNKKKLPCIGKTEISPTQSGTLGGRKADVQTNKKIIPTPQRGRGKRATSPNKPVDTSIASLFDTAYAHPVLQRGPFLWLAYDQWVKKMHTLISGTEEGPDQWVGHMSKARKHLDSIILCKSDRALPYMSVGHRSESWLNKTRSGILNVPILDTKGRTIDVVTWPKEIDENGFLRFDDDDDFDRRIRPDVLVFATGYSSELSFLSPDYPTLAQANVRGVYKDGDVTVGFIGFARPSLGAIPPLAELQAQLWILRLLQHQFPSKMPLHRDPNAVRPYEMDYKLRPRAGYDLYTMKRGVDHESYAYQLALDIGSATTFTYVIGRGWKVFFTWAMGSNFNTKFRLVGPWKWEVGAEEIIRTELFYVVKRPGGFLYLLTYSILPLIIFGSISVGLYAAFGLFDLVMGIGEWLAMRIYRDCRRVKKHSS